MAELDLKEIWKQNDGKSSQEHEIDVDAIISKKSKGILQKIKSVLLVEFWFNNIISPLVVLFYLMEFNIWSGIAIGVVAVAYFFYYQFLIKEIKKFDYSGDVKQSLTKVYKYLKFYVSHYVVILWLSVVVIFWAIFTAGFMEGYNAAMENKSLPEGIPEYSLAQALLVLALVIFVPILIAVGLHFAVKLLYSDEIKKLKKIIDDFEE